MGSMQFQHIGLSTALLAYAAAKAGHSVHLNIDHLDLDYLPELTAMFPLSASEIPGAVSNYNALLRLAALFPTLINQQRVYTFADNDVPGAKYLWMADRVLGRDRELASFPVNQAVTPVHQILMQTGFSNSVQVIEYRFDRIGAINNLLGACVEMGAVVHKTENTEALCFVGDSKFISRQVLKINNFTLPVNNPFTLKFKGAVFSFLSVNGNTYLCFQATGKKEQLNASFERCRQIVGTLGFPIENSKLDDYFQGIEQANKLGNIIPDLKLMQFQKQLAHLQKRWLKPVGLKLPLPSSPLPLSFSADQYKQLEINFDLAKQTGIGIASFSLYYGRYAAHIDWMIEKAYELMDQERNHEILWRNAEKAFLQHQGLLTTYQ